MQTDTPITLPPARTITLLHPQAGALTCAEPPLDALFSALGAPADLDGTAAPARSLLRPLIAHPPSGRDPAAHETAVNQWLPALTLRQALEAHDAIIGHLSEQTDSETASTESGAPQTAANT